MTRRMLLLSLFLFLHSSAQDQQNNRGIIEFFPEHKTAGIFSADEYAHQVKIENIMFTENFVSSLGGVFPMVNLDLFGASAQASVATSVHFEVRPQGTAHVVNTDFYVDYVILDIGLGKNYVARFVAGHTSHHLSDNWYERLHLTEAFHYSRDYVESSLMYILPGDVSLFAGANYGYIFHLQGKENKRWMFHAGGEKDLVRLFDAVTMYSSVDIKLREEANYASSNAYQVGVKIPMRTNHLLRFAYQYRHGMDERGQFFGKHISRHTLGLYIEV